MPTVERLGHVGLYVDDLEAMRDFYETTIGLTVTDVVDEAGLVFMSADPEREHHELLLIRDPANAGSGRVNQVSFRCSSLDDVRDFWQRFNERSIPIEMTVSHGNAVGVYFTDPEGNTVEVYWDTGLKARQPYMEHVDMAQEPAEINALVEASVAEHGDTGFVGPQFRPPDD
jgi:catechol-2,3-dioxygenase